MKKLLPLALAGIVFVSCGSKTENAKIESKLAVQQAVKGGYVQSATADLIANVLAHNKLMIGYTTRSLSSSVAGAVGGAVVGFAVKKATKLSKEEKEQIKKLVKGRIVYDCLWKHADELKANKEKTIEYCKNYAEDIFNKMLGYYIGLDYPICSGNILKDFITMGLFDKKCYTRGLEAIYIKSKKPIDKETFDKYVYDVLYYDTFIGCMPNINPDDKKLPEKYFACRKKAEKQADKMFKKLKKIADKYFEKWAKKYSS